MNSTRGAFTFVEVLAAMVFLGILMPVVISALITANRAAVVAERSTIAAQLGENKLGELLLGNAWSSASSSGDFGTEWSGYRWELSKPTWQTGAMTELTLDVFYKVQGIEHDARLGQLVHPAVEAGQLVLVGRSIDDQPEGAVVGVLDHVDHRAVEVRLVEQRNGHQQ